MFYPSLEKAAELSKNYSKVPVSLEIYMDFHTPIAVLSHIREKYDEYFLLESIEGGEKWARYTFLGFNPKELFYVKEGRAFHKKAEGTKELAGNPIDLLKDILKDYTAPKDKNLPPLTGGAVGYFGYETVKYVEDIALSNDDHLKAEDIKLMFFDELIAFDHLKQKITLIANIDGNAKNITKAYEEAKNKLMALYQLINEPARKHTIIFDEEINFASNMTKEAFMENVMKAKAYIENGDIFQVVLSQVFKTKLNCELFDVYRVLRTINPSPYMYFMKFKDIEVAGASPETLVKVQDGTVITQPIAGTRRRGKTDEEDARIEEDLLGDKKERAEHNMLVDLARNDVGKISEFNSVQVSDYMAFKRLSHVIHLTTNVRGKLRQGFDSIDAVRELLPAGTLSGAPKVRAMEIIEELETEKRGVYGGAIGYIGYDGNLDTCIAIRTVVKKDNIAYIQAGAGIVLDSDPESEYKETITKASAVFDAIRKVGEMK
ncbi:anthranilate synthase component I [Cellulosilyticum sp. I15G10I2]|uniref:anthranilate synthase component I n=1 Tax=Cellulosilyticum sp. I15G10I2 TaxID=1892843 RepID=UPI00085CB304|nr:anthranilate synthase component I [Cellulosilyticum sp. I15G10I2]